MSANPLNALKRKLEDDELPLRKRLFLAKNVVRTQYFPSGPKERLIAEWLETISNDNQLTAEDLKDILGWLRLEQDLSSELKSKLVIVTSNYLKTNELNSNQIQNITAFIENEKIQSQLQTHIDSYINIITSVLKLFKENIENNEKVCETIFNGLIKFHKESKKKNELILLILQGECIEIVLHYLNVAALREKVIEVCQNIIFPMTKKSYFIMYLRLLIQKSDIDEHVKDKGDMLFTVIKILEVFFNYPNGRFVEDVKFLENFIEVFAACFKEDAQLIFAFYIVAFFVLDIEKNYVTVTANLNEIQFKQNSDKIKRNLLLSMLEILFRNEIDLSVKLTDTLSGNISKGDIKKNFLLFIQAAILNNLKLEGKLDKTTLKIIKASLKLDPSLIEPKIDLIIPAIMVNKKTQQLKEVYIETVNCFLEVIFKLGRGVNFINQIIPKLRTNLEAGNTEKIDLISKYNGTDKQKGKILYGDDIFPENCINLYGILTSEILFRQNNELLSLLQKGFEEHCLVGLEENVIEPSTIILTEVMSAILCEHFRRNKMADHTVSQQVAEEYWSLFNQFRERILDKFGVIIVKVDCNTRLVNAFLKLCQSYIQLKLLNLKYGNLKCEDYFVPDNIEPADMNFVLPCLKSKDWNKLYGRIVDAETKEIFNNLLAMKLVAIQLKQEQNDNNSSMNETKTHLIKEISNNFEILQKERWLTHILVSNLDSAQSKNIAKIILNNALENSENDLLNNVISQENNILSHLVLEVLKNMCKSLESSGNMADLPLLSKALTKSNFDIVEYLSKTKVVEYFNALSMKVEEENSVLISYLAIMNNLQIYYLGENIQLAAIFVLLSLKKAGSKKLRKNIDQTLLSIFEMAPRAPDLFKLFPIEFIFSFEENSFIDFLKLKNKSYETYAIKRVLETAVKKVKTNNEVVKIIVKLLLSNLKLKKEESNLDYFHDNVFQISCIILPLIAKEKRAITTSAHRSVLAELQEKLHKSLLKCFKTINLSNEKSQLMEMSGNPENSGVIEENSVATLNAMEAFSLTLSKYCESNDAEEIKNLDCLWTGLEFFVNNAINSIKSPTSKSQHVESSIQLINVALRNKKKLETHKLFAEKEVIFHQIWRAVIDRVTFQFDSENGGKCDAFGIDMAVTLKFVCELCSIQSFTKDFVMELEKFLCFKDPSTPNAENLTDTIKKHKVSKYLIQATLKSNIIGQKCGSIAKLTHNLTKNVITWLKGLVDKPKSECIKIKENDLAVNINDSFCELLVLDLDIISGVVLAAKKININFEYLDAIFEIQHVCHSLLGVHPARTCDISWDSYFKLFDSCLGVLNSLLISREEILEDRWPCYLQCYRALILSLSEKSSSQHHFEKSTEDRLAEIAHRVERLTFSISKRKTHVSRLATYAIADICASIERQAPIRQVRQHLENSVVTLIQISDSSYAMSFLRRSLAGNTGQMTMTNMYTMYKRYHKYVGNA